MRGNIDFSAPVSPNPVNQKNVSVQRRPQLSVKKVSLLFQLELTVHQSTSNKRHQRDQCKETDFYKELRGYNWYYGEASVTFFPLLHSRLISAQPLVLR